MTLNPKLHAYNLLRNGAVVAMFSNYALAMNTGDMRKRMEHEADPYGETKWAVQWGIQSWPVRRIIQQKVTPKEFTWLTTQ